jgi:hypothetical protein
MRSSRFCAAFVLLLCACDGDDISDNPSGQIPAECNPLGGTHCLMPWPSSTYLEADSTTTTGFRVALPAEAMPVNIDDIPVDPTPWNRYDGFSVAGAITAAFPNGVGEAGLPGHADIAASIADASPILLINAETGERPIFFAEIDKNAKPEEAALLIRPLERLRPNSRYVVGLRDTLVDSAGAPLERPAAFEALVSGAGFSHPRFADLEARAPEIFAALEGAGVSRDELVLAWDFHTASDEGLTRDLVTMRDKALPAIGEAGANLAFEMAETAGDPALTRSIYVGIHDAPTFLSNGELDDSVLLRGADDLPELDGVYDANFALVIPKCVETAQLPRPVVVFGHGLFGNSEEYATDDFLQEIADEKCFVVIAGDWIGLTNRQIVSVALSMNDLNRGTALSEKLAQAVINFIALENLVRGPLATAPETQFEGEPMIDTDNVWYLGGSLGGIMGGTFMAYDPNIRLGALGVPGSNWSLLMERSVAWLPLQVAATAAYTDQYDYQMLVSLLALSLERWDPITIARRIFDDPIPGTPAKQLLIYEAINDSLVTNLATEMLVRTMGLPVCGPSVKLPYAIGEELAPAPSAFTVYDENVPVPTTTNVPPEDDNGTHGGVNERQAVLDQIEHFFFNEEVINTCGEDGSPVACDCATGACD